MKTTLTILIVTGLVSYLGYRSYLVILRGCCDQNSLAWYVIGAIMCTLVGIAFLAKGLRG